jgi:hypothetical protein
MSFVILGVFCLAVAFIIVIISSIVQREWEWSNLLLSIILSAVLFITVWFSIALFGGAIYHDWSKNELSETHFEIAEQNNYCLISADDNKYVYLTPGTYNFIYADSDQIPVGVSEDNVKHVTVYTDVKGEVPRVEVREWHVKNKFIRGLTGDDLVYIDYIIYLPNSDCITMRGY